MDPMTLLSLAGGLGGGGTEVNNKTNTNVSTQLSIGLSNQVGAGSPSPAGGSLSAPSVQSAADGGYDIPVWGANQSSNPSADLNKLLNGGGQVSAVLGSKGLLYGVVAAIGAAALYFGLKGKK